MLSRILIVDDSLIDRIMIQEMLADYETITAEGGSEALEKLRTDKSVQLVILDLNMPDMSGFEVLETINNTPEFENIRVIILTNYEEVDNEIKGLELGAVDYVRKPVNMLSLLVRIKNHMQLIQQQNEVEMDNKKLDQLVYQKTREVVNARDITINALVSLLEVRNIETSKHTKRTREMMSILANHLKHKHIFSDILKDDYIDLLVATTPLHDIGKVGICDAILLKPGKLTPQEYEIMKQHVDCGVNALQNELISEQETPDFIKIAIEIIAYHHEKYDGSGYPKGLAGDAIPLAGRLMAIIDVFDALINKRVYKEAYDFEETVSLITAERGKHFDPLIVDAFQDVKESFLAVINKYLVEDDDDETDYC
ncbi:response regulator [Fusibacter paucivorans]|uniref:Stage 0 sporulation protein A homolog n=1 Tax=Fusibacter paucivorans TaxID=76009 RepID=A0ABS5PKA3_9FIRM|nr:HD domain-containing phosphohydrolase [Fusibacter paucivorans]MBS7525590.1 response regulator [Fusibacter paucivorans]